MIKKAYRILSLVLCMIILLSVLVPTAFAAVIPSPEDTITPNHVPLIHPITGDQYASRTFPTIDDAKAAYDSCWVYERTYEIYAGNV